MAYYIDTSALVKLVVGEAESDALRRWIGQAHPELVSSDLVRAELLRAVRRAAVDLAVQARRVLDSITLLAVATATFESAARLDPTMLRTLDALHLAAALELGDDLEGLVTYDDRLAEAAQRSGIAVMAPA
ncbi:MAG: type II toxin-antitoxin system VapC family toxin [Nocardioidaceae bacterium]|nr:MAG: type II toxin-antitoxin system VapC family toxin [Nocardioidaceae bacterium]